MRITDEFYISEREFKIIHTDSLPVDIPRFVIEKITLYIDGRIYNGTLTMMHYIPKDRKADASISCIDPGRIRKRRYFDRKEDSEDLC